MKRYKQNNSYFKKVDSERKAYWLGFLYADGCITNNLKQIIIMLHPKDKYLLEKFLGDLDSDRTINFNRNGYVYINICCKEMAKDLVKLGCVPRKSLILKFPTYKIVPQKFIRHFIRGYMDGDGCISIYKVMRADRNIPFNKCEIKFIGTYHMLNGIKKFFKSDKRILINKHSDETCQISFAGRKYRKYVDELYKGATVYLKRKKYKWDRYNKYLDELDKKNQLKNSRIIVKLDYDTRYLGEYLFQELKKDFDIGAIMKCCKYRVKHKSYKKFRWLFKDDYERIKKDNLNIENLFGYKSDKKIDKYRFSNSVEQYDLNMNLINVWKNPKTAAIAHDTTAKAIRKVCNGEGKTCRSYIWKYTHND